MLVESLNVFHKIKGKIDEKQQQVMIAFHFRVCYLQKNYFAFS
jgi:hypothetical protein